MKKVIKDKDVVKRLMAALEMDAALLTAEPIKDADEVSNSLGDEVGAPKWFTTVRNYLAVIFGGASKIKVLQVTPGGARFKFRADGFILNKDNTTRMAALSRKLPNLQFAVYTQNLRMYLVVAEKDPVVADGPT